MNEEEASLYSEKKFKALSELEAEWNKIHSLGIIKAIDELAGDNKSIDKKMLRALAWVHDIGKIEGNENHAEKSIRILERDFQLDEVERDCIANHGSSSRPMTPEGKLFRYCDGLSLFYPETILFYFFGEAKEGKTFEDIKKKIKSQYEKYCQAYSDNPKAVYLLKRKYKSMFE